MCSYVYYIRRRTLFVSFSLFPLSFFDKCPFFLSLTHTHFLLLSLSLTLWFILSLSSALSPSLTLSRARARASSLSAPLLVRLSACAHRDKLKLRAHTRNPHPGKVAPRAHTS